MRGRITHIEGIPVEQVFQKVRALYAGNAGWSAYMATYTLTSPDALLSVGLVDDEAAEFSVRVGERLRSVRLKAEPLEARTIPEESWWFLSPRHPAAAGWTHALKPQNLPPVLLSPELNYIQTRCDGDVLYVRYTRAADAPGQETLRAFGTRLLAEIASQRPRKLLLDLRFNTGGNLLLAQPLMEGLSQSPLARSSGAIAVLIGPSTFSAGITPAAWMRSKTESVLVGTHPGDQPDFWAEGGNVTLPNSRIVMHYADVLHHYSGAARPAGVQLYPLDIDVHDLEPDVAVDWRWRDYVSGADPVAAAAAGGPLRCRGYGSGS